MQRVTDPTDVAPTGPSGGGFGVLFSPNSDDFVRECGYSAVPVTFRSSVHSLAA
jgi:hypothetical protein